jgi:hypothetical protein
VGRGALVSPALSLGPLGSALVGTTQIYGHSASYHDLLSTRTIRASSLYHSGQASVSANVIRESGYLSFASSGSATRS